MGFLMPGSMVKNTDDYSGTTSYYVHPGWVGNKLKLGARYDKSMKDEIILIVRNDMIRNFSSKKPNLFIKINGKEIELSPVGDRTECSTGSSVDIAHCYQEYLLSVGLVKQILEAKDFRIKLLLRDGIYVSDTAKNTDGMTSFYDGVKKLFKEAGL